MKRQVNIVYNMDCMDGLMLFDDNFFDLAICDPPYGIEKSCKANSLLSKYGGLDDANDRKPDKAYFDLLFKKSKNQVIFGYNYLSDMLPSTKEFIFWYKHNPVDSFSDGELAWTSFNKTAKCFDFPYYGFIGKTEERIHPMQKPVELYNWILNTYAKPGYKILDSHVGSGSSRIACYDLCFYFIGFEINKMFFERQEKRFQEHISQIRMEVL